MSLLHSLILTVTDSTVLLLPPVSDRQGAVFCATFEDHESMDTLNNILQDYARAPIVIIADTTAQRFSFDTLPASLSQKDARKLAHRRLCAQMTGISFTAPLLSGNMATYVGIEECPALSAVIHLLPKESLNRITITSAACESVRILRSLNKQSTQGWSSLCVTTNGTSRLTIAKNGLPLYSNVSHNCSLELQIRDARRYLARFGLTEEEDLKTCHLLSGGEISSAACSPTLTVAQLAEQLSCPLRPSSEETPANCIYALSLASQNDCVGSIRTKVAERNFVLDRLSSRMLSAAKFFFLASLLLLCIAMIDLGTATLVSQQTLKITSAIKERIDKRYAEAETGSIDLRTLQRAANAEQTFSESPAYGHIVPLLSSLSTSLTDFGVAEKLEWETGKLVLTYPITNFNDELLRAAIQKFRQDHPALEISYSVHAASQQTEGLKLIKLEINTLQKEVH